MSVASKLLGAWMLKRTVSSTTPLFMRLLLGMAALVVFAVVGAILGAFIMAGLLWLIFDQMVAAGIPPQNAKLLLAGSVLVLFVVAISMAQKHWRNMRKLANNIIYLQSPIGGKLNAIADAFMDGYEHPRARTAASR